MSLRLNQTKNIAIIPLQLTTKMSIQPKTEQNIIGYVPCSRPTMSLESLIKDLQDLNKEKTLITKKELEYMKTKMKKLEEENSKLKADLASKEADLAAKDADLAEKEEERLFYDSNFHKNVKELTKMKAENKSLKMEIGSLKASSAEEEKTASSAIQAALPINDARTDDAVEISVESAILAIPGKTGNGSTPKPRATRKRSRLNNDTFTSQTSSKKPKTVSPIPNCDNPWKCFVCNSVRFESIDELRQHLLHAHPMKSFFCERCSFAADCKENLHIHKRKHDVNDLKYSDSNIRCKFCDICFDRTSTLSAHIKVYH